MVFGVTGGFACGKSTVSKMFRDLGAKLIDADKIAHVLLDSPKLKRSLVSYFGKDILTRQKKISRKKLANIVFSKPNSLRFLNSVVHPEVIKKLKSRIASFRNRILVLDIPLLYESRLENLVDYIVVVKCLKLICLKRAQENNFSKSQALKIIQAQLPLRYKVEQADYVIDNSYSLKKTNMEVKKTWRDMLRKQNKK
ncbi:MAG: dephospho-CoA kinase [Candidatus Gygaella obscura]|nr:dephospho-CoA kinase [Candidatus Gygaella obscura]